MQLEEDIAKIVALHGASLYDTQIVKENDETIFRVSIVKEGGVDIDTCVAISHDLSPFLDVHPPLRGAYRLEVSSPGIERKLTKPLHFKHSIGEKVKLKVLGKEKLKGKLIEADDEGIVVETKEGKRSFAYAELGVVKTYFEF